MATPMTKDEIIKKLKIENVEPEVQNQILENVASTVSARILNGVYERLSDADIDELDRLTQANDEGPVEWFIKSKFDHYDEYAAQVEQEVVGEIAERSDAVPGQ